VAKFSAPSLQDVDIRLVDLRWLPIMYFPRFINEIDEHSDSVTAPPTWLSKRGLFALRFDAPGLHDVLQIGFRSESLHNSH
jgi:hypothetical protein